MAQHFSSSVEYGLHCLLYLVDAPEGIRPSSRDLAAFQGVSPTYLAKLFTKFEKAGLVEVVEGVRGGYRLARAPAEISVFDVVEALEGPKRLFKCREIRSNCVLFGDAPPAWATRSVCEIHAVMLKAECAMRETLKAHSLADLAARVAVKMPTAFQQRTLQWFGDQPRQRRSKPSLLGESQLDQQEIEKKAIQTHHPMKRRMQ